MHNMTSLAFCPIRHPIVRLRVLHFEPRMSMWFILILGDMPGAKETLARMKYFVNIEEQIHHLLPLDDQV